MKKSLIFIAMLAIATALFAENETVSCESDLGKCTYELSSDSLSKECTCRDGNGIGEAEMFENGAASSALPTEEECQAELLIICQDAGINCENEAGECEMKPNGDYTCWCFGIEGYNDGNGVFGEEGCNAAGLNTAEPSRQLQERSAPIPKFSMYALPTRKVLRTHATSL